MRPVGDNESGVEAEGGSLELGKTVAIALVGGVLIGVLGAAFRTGLIWAQTRHTEVVEWAQAWPWLGWVVPVAIGALGAGIARWLVRMQPLASGSGVQHVEAVMRGEAGVASIWVVPIKFFGGLLSIGTGLVLGREGPTVQMGAVIGSWLAQRLRCSVQTIRDLQAALGGAGLAAAFNAPIGGAMFVFEEVARAFYLRLTVATMVGTAAAICSMRLLLGNTPDFDVSAVYSQEYRVLIVYGVCGALLGVLGVFYNKCVIWGLDAFAGLKGWPVEVRAAAIGAIVGLVAWFAPNLVGGGDPVSQRILDGNVPLLALLMILLLRWLLGALSYASGTPGGLFAPLLLVGAALGAIFAISLNSMLPLAEGLSVTAFAVIGMAAFFTGVVRAPLTGVLLIAEMTATTSLMLPLLAACVCAMLSASLLNGEPIYDTLRKRMLQGQSKKIK